MSRVTLTFEVDEELQTEIAKLALASDRSVAQILHEATENYVRRERETAKYAAWLDREVKEGLHEADVASEEDWIPNEQVMAEAHAALDARIKSGRNK